MLEDGWARICGLDYGPVPTTIDDGNDSSVFTYRSPFQDNRKMAHELALAALKNSDHSPSRFYEEYFTIYRQALKDYNRQEGKE